MSQAKNTHPEVHPRTQTPEITRVNHRHRLQSFMKFCYDFDRKILLNVFAKLTIKRAVHMRQGSRDIQFTSICPSSIFSADHDSLSRHVTWPNHVSFHLLTFARRGSCGPTTGCRARSTFLWVHRNLLWQLSRNLQSFKLLAKMMVSHCQIPFSLAIAEAILMQTSA